jgi:hypothetical protein
MSDFLVALEKALFLYIGWLYVRQTSGNTAKISTTAEEHRPLASPKSSTSKETPGWTRADYILAVNLCGSAVYLIYVAWHDGSERWQMTENDCVKYGMDPIAYERFKSQNDGDWARLPGFEDDSWPYTSRRVVAKVAENVNEWILGELSAPFTVGPALLSPDSVPILHLIGPIM